MSLRPPSTGLPIFFFNGDQVGASPAQSKKTITWIGKLDRAALTVNFGEKYGWGLREITFNKKVYKVEKKLDPLGSPISTLAGGIAPKTVTIDVTGAMINGDNVLTVAYDHPFSAHIGDRNTLTAFVTPEITGAISTIPSLEKVQEDFNKQLANATVPMIAILGIIAAIVIAVAVIIVKLKGGALLA